MKIGLFSLESPFHDSKYIDSTLSSFIKDIETGIGQNFEVIDIENFNKVNLPLIFVKTGGTEGEFKKLYDKIEGPFILLSSGMHNSLAASMEIITFLRQDNKRAEIIHGDTEYIIQRIKILSKIFDVKLKLSNSKFGVIGKPSDWLIASDVDYSLLKDNTGINVIDIPIEELKDEIYKKHTYYNKDIKKIKEKGYKTQEINRALEIYGAFKSLIEKYNLSGLTVRCFDLLKDIKSTGCLGLALLNAEGIPAACEGDIPSLLSMALITYLTGQPVFMANPSRIDVERNRIVFAHCTLPINMPKNYSFTTHFESGIGVAVKGEIKLGRGTIFKVAGDMSNYFVSGCNILKNLKEENLCRTQIELEVDKDVRYFLLESIGNHHIIVNGNYSKLVNEFFNWI